MSEQVAGVMVRDWLERQADANGGYRQLAARAGLTGAWARFAAAGSVPRAGTVRKLATVLGETDATVGRLIEDVSAFWSAQGAARGRGVVRLVCPQCGQVRTIPFWRLREYVGAIDKGDRYESLCHSCSGKRVASKGRAALAAALADAARRRMEVTGREETDGERALAIWIEQHGGIDPWLCDSRGVELHWLESETHHLVEAGNRRSQGALALVNKIRQRDGAAKEIARLLWVEQSRRQMGDGDVKLGKERKEHLARDWSKLAAKRPQASHHPRVIQAYAGRAALAGTFSLCPLCGLLIYETRSERTKRTEENPKHRAWHGPCFRAWRGIPAYIAWLQDRRRAEVGNLRQALRRPMPMPPEAVRSVAPSVLFDGYSSLIWRAAGVSYPDIAARLGKREDAVRKSGEVMAARLPASWSLVFPQRSSNAVRQQLFALPQSLADALPERSERAAALRRLGIPADVIAAVTGYRVGGMAADCDPGGH